MKQIDKLIINTPYEEQKDAGYQRGFRGSQISHKKGLINRKKSSYTASQSE